MDFTILSSCSTRKIGQILIEKSVGTTLRRTEELFFRPTLVRV